MVDITCLITGAKLPNQYFLSLGLQGSSWSLGVLQLLGLIIHLKLPREYKCAIWRWTKRWLFDLAFGSYRCIYILQHGLKMDRRLTWSLILL